MSGEKRDTLELDSECLTQMSSPDDFKSPVPQTLLKDFWAPGRESPMAQAGGMPGTEC